MSFEELSNGAITSIKGNSAITISGTGTNADDTIIGYCIIRNWLVVWSTNCHDTTGGRGTICRCDLSAAAPAWNRLCEFNNMMLTTKYPIYNEAIGYYESDDIINVYWTDNFNMIRHINIYDNPYTGTVDTLDILSNVYFQPMIIANIGSGSLNVGMVQYAYQYYNINGTETVYSACTEMVHLTNSSETLSAADIRLYEGSDALDTAGNVKSSGKSVTVWLQDADNGYDMVRVVSLHYGNLNQTPTIHIVGEYEVTDNLIITDYGVYTKGTITLNAYRSLGNHELYCKTISQKGNKALIGNITEKFFDVDFDARAYRWNSVASGQTCEVYNTKAFANETIVKGGAAWPAGTYQIGGSSVTANHDAICPYNYDYVSGSIDEAASYSATGNDYKYQSDGATLGGEGPNIKYEFFDYDYAHDISSSAKYHYPNKSNYVFLSTYDSYKNPLISGYIRCYKRDEVYRFAAILINARGQESFPKWIADIKFPTSKEYPITSISAMDVYMMHPIAIKFTVNTASLQALGVTQIKIVRVERTMSDRTILTQGIASNMFYVSGGSTEYNNYIVGYPRATLKTPTEGIHASFVKQDKVVQFISPEINYMKNITPSNGDYLKLCTKLENRRSFLQRDADTLETTGLTERADAIGGSTFAALYNANPWINITRYRRVDAAGINLSTYNILAGQLAGIVEKDADESNRITLPGASYQIINRSVDFTAASIVATNHEGPSGTCLILSLASAIDTASLTEPDELEQWLIDYKRPGIATSQYGGITYESRQNNTYIDASPIIDITGGSDDINVVRGDTFITYHEHLRTIWECDDNDGGGVPDITADKRFCAITVFPCESIMNLDLTHGFKFSNNYTNYYIHALREDSGTYNGSFADPALPNVATEFEQDKNMYEYNTVYSQANTSKIYVMEPYNWKSTVIQDTLVKISEEKYPGEEVDSYLKFLTDNEKILPTQFGPINDLFLFKNYMMVFFDHAFGTLSIDERALLPIQNNSILELGTANNLQHFDFIADRSGSIHPMSINRMGTGFGWYDAYSNAFGYYNGETQDIGLTKGISSDIKRFSDYIKIGRDYYRNHLYGGNVMTVENKKYKESYISFMVSELAACLSKVNGVSVTFTLTTSPGTFANAEVCINGVEYYADITGTGAGTLVINVTDNPSLNTGLYTAASRYFIYYKDLSTVISFDNILHNFQHETQIFPQWLFDYNDILFEIFYNSVVYEEDAGNYGGILWYVS